MWEIDIGEQGPLRPKPGRHRGPSAWLVRAGFVALHVAMLGTALAWFGWHPLGGDRGASPPGATRPGPRLVPPKPSNAASPAPSGLPNGPATPRGRLAPDPRGPRLSSPPAPANRPDGGGDVASAGPLRPKSLRGARTDPDPAPTRLGDREAVALLEAKGLAREPSGFVLISESLANSRLTALRSRAEEFNRADVRLAKIDQVLAQLRELNQAITDVDRAITQLGAAMAQYPATYTRGRWYHGNNNFENDDYETLKARKIESEVVRSELVHRRDTLRADQPSQRRGEAAEDLKRRREAAVAGLGELQGAIASTKKGYAELASDPEVKRALAGLGGAGLGPSREFLQVERECREFERSAAQLKLVSD